MPGELQIPDFFNLASYFVDRHLIEGRGGKIALLTGDQRFTYAEVAELVNKAGNGLRALGVSPGDRVLILLPDGIEFAAAYFGAVKIGAVAVPTNPGLRAADYAGMFQESGARAIVAHASFWPAIEPAWRATGPAPAIIAGGNAAESLCWNDWLGAQSASLEPAATSAGDDAFWLWTSGSTGFPKAAVHRHEDWLHCCELYARRVLDIGEHDVVYSTSKLFHAYGLGNSLLFPFYAGASAFLEAQRPRAQQVLSQVAQARPTLFFSVPTLYAAMLSGTEADPAQPRDLPSVRLGVSAAEPLPGEIYRRWKERFGWEILDGLGSTEALHIYISARAGEPCPGSSGWPVAGYEIRITGEDGQAATPGAVGDLWVRGPSVCRSFWNRPQLCAERLRDGWLFTGDKYYSDPEGRYWYAGRSDDMFRVSGQWVSPAEVEAVLIEHPFVLESAVVPFSDANNLLKPRACVVLKPGIEPGEHLVRELQELVKSRAAPHQYPRQVVFVAELPKTATGKIQRYKLRGER